MTAAKARQVENWIQTSTLLAQLHNTAGRTCKKRANPADFQRFPKDLEFDRAAWHEMGRRMTAQQQTSKGKPCPQT